MPRANFEKKNKKFCTQNVFLGIFDATSPYKNLVKKIGKTSFFPHAVFEGGGNGCGFGGFILLAIQGPPSHKIRGSWRAPPNSEAGSQEPEAGSQELEAGSQTGSENPGSRKLRTPKSELAAAGGGCGRAVPILCIK
jgi:hypothetical protein